MSGESGDASDSVPAKEGERRMGQATITTTAGKAVAVGILATCLARSHGAGTNEWLGLNYILGNTSADIGAATNWSRGTVPGPEDAVRFSFHGIDGAMGDLHIRDTDTNFNPHGAFEFLANCGGEGWKQTSDIHIGKPLTLERMRLSTWGGSSGRVQDRIQVDVEDNDGASLTLTGSGEVLDVRDAEWDGIKTGGDIILTGEAITFADSSRGGGMIRGAEHDKCPCTMFFGHPTGSIHLGWRAGATLGLGEMGLSVRSGQTWTAHTNAYVALHRNGTRSILDSPDTDRLDNLGEVDLRITHTQYGSGSSLVLRGGTYGSLHASGGGNRTFRITLQDDVTFAGRFPGVDHGLLLDSPSASSANAAQLDLAGHGLRVLNGDLVLRGGAFIKAAGARILVGGNLRHEGSSRHTGINGDAETVVSLTGDFRSKGRSPEGSGLHLSTVDAIGGGAVQHFEVGDSSAQPGGTAASFAIGTLNIGLGTTNALVKLVNEELNDNPLVATNETDRIGEKLVARTLSVNAGSTLDVNGQVVNVTSLTVAPDAWLDLDSGRRPAYNEVLTNFVGFGNRVARWNAFADRVKDSSSPSSRFAAVGSSGIVVDTPFGAGALLDFDGVDDLVELPADGLGSGAVTAFTVELWLRVDRSPGGWGHAMVRGDKQDTIAVPASTGWACTGRAASPTARRRTAGTSRATRACRSMPAGTIWR
jgi:hypothetical protein